MHMRPQVTFCINICLSVDGNWSPWSEWTECTVTCNTGKRSRARMCDNPEPQFGGKHCGNDGDEDQECGTIPCPS